MPLLIMKSNFKLSHRLILKIIFTSTSMPQTMTKDCNALVIATMTRMSGSNTFEFSLRFSWSQDWYHDIGSISVCLPLSLTQRSLLATNNTNSYHYHDDDGDDVSSRFPCCVFSYFSLVSVAEQSKRLELQKGGCKILLLKDEIASLQKWPF